MRSVLLFSPKGNLVLTIKIQYASRINILRCQSPPLIGLSTFSMPITCKVEKSPPWASRKCIETPKTFLRESGIVCTVDVLLYRPSVLTESAINWSTTTTEAYCNLKM